MAGRRRVTVRGDDPVDSGSGAGPCRAGAGDCRNAIRVRPYSRAELEAALVTACNATAAGPQVKYLTRYCQRLGARSFIEERHYIDRHYLDEYAAFYSRTLSPPRNCVTRFHVFADELRSDAFEQELAASVASQAAKRRLERRLNKGYLGFVSVRPLRTAPVGRTVLASLPPRRNRREIRATGPHPVHLGHLALSVVGLPFQQQDVAVGACGTAALWSALARASRLEGIRAPTPAEVSEKAGRYSLGNGARLHASQGLTVEELTSGVRAHEFSPEPIDVLDRPEVFAFAVHTYLLSGIPVLLALQGARGGHAVTAAGFELGEGRHDQLETTLPARSSRLRGLYVHDDRLGPYARAYVKPFPRSESHAAGVVLGLQGDNWYVAAAVAPVYPKVRLPAESLLALAEAHATYVETIVGQRRSHGLEIECYYAQAGSYLGSLPGRIEPRRAAPFMSQVALSRWCGVVRWLLGGRPVAELVYDTTDVLRSGGLGLEPLRAVVGLKGPFASGFRALAESLRVPGC